MPSDHWVCSRCNTANGFGQSHCTHCEFSLQAQEQAIQPPPPKTAHDAMAWGSSEFKKNLCLFFPEAIPAVGIVLVSPFLLLSLLSQRQFLAASIFALGIFTSVWLFIRAAAAESRYVAYAAILAVLGFTWLAFSVGG